ncbi:hypothetical protein HNQ94_002883 [Salirhabdus euzebyi]|uniref:Uncharacterized protein n=1 Tax=Salirhabdus euzebyi TaxID=394506 RepID=A0A841Q7J4_9BACI|nr:hypothetical protein [Salirhabdus euzebyi]MBB6454401.1 hypothetical protein [Salirhabdus euzebyi]
MTKTTFIALLPSKIQQEIYEELKRVGLSQEDIQNAMDSRLSDLEDTINITKYLQ